MSPMLEYMSIVQEGLRSGELSLHLKHLQTAFVFKLFLLEPTLCATALVVTVMAANSDTYL